jgi:beta-glucanase (GH16 family)
MMYTQPFRQSKYSFFLLSLLLLMTSVTEAQNWNLVWSDEFDQGSIQSSNWNFETGGGGWGNAELENYTNRPQNATINNGQLNIIAQQESYGGSNYTSARMNTSGLHSWTYGKVEAYIKLPSGQGLWPAFWMLGTNIPQVGWPQCGEIDIMERVNTQSTIEGTIHWEAGGAAQYGGNTNFDPTQYHLYSVVWDSASITWYLDNTQYWTANIANNINNTNAFHEPFFIILNLAVGGSWPGNPDGSTTFPATMYVDYVRVYQVNKPPVISISAPASNSTFCSGNPISLTASASDPDGSVSSVSFYDGSTFLGTVTSAPFTYSWSNAGNGSHTITAVVTDNSNTTTTSTAINIQINNSPPAPTVTSPVTHCQNATATTLSANGTGLKWYTTATGGASSAAAPTPSTANTGTTNYYVSQTTSGCESSRAVITVTVNATPSAPIVTSPVTYCQGETALPFSATGTGLKWYTTATVGASSATTPTPSTANTGTTSYYVSQSTTGCESSRAVITVTVNATPSAPIVTSPVTYCRRETALPFSATGTGLKWYIAASGGSGSSTALTPSTANTGTTNYYVSQTTSGCESSRAVITVTVNATPSAPIVTSPVTYCQGETALPFSATGTGLKWYTTATGGSGSSTVLTPSIANIGTTSYYVSQTTTGCESSRAVIIVTVTAPSTWYQDLDGDGKGDPNVTQLSCNQPTGYVSVAGDGCPNDPDKVAAGNCGCGKTEQSCLDCAGVVNGTATIDHCNVCTGGTTGLAACTTTGTISSINSTSMLIYPQPFENTTKVELKNGSVIESISIYSSTGSLAYSRSGIASTEIEIGESIAEGLYTVIIQTQDGLYTSKFVKTK